MSRKTDLVEYIFRQLGEEIRQTYLTPNQLDDLITDAIQYFQQRSSMAVEEAYPLFLITSGVKEYDLSEYNLRSVVEVMATNNPLDVFSLERIILDSVLLNNNPSKSSGQSGSGYGLVDLYLMRQWIQTARKMLVKEISFNYNELDGVLKLTSEPTSTRAGIIRGYRYLFDASDDDDGIYLYPWIKQYVLALAWIRVGTNLKLYGNVPLPSGMTFDADFAISEGTRLQDKLEEQLQQVYNEPPDFMVG
ncbi:MAG: hypothetical protein M0R03_20305 [Novosphingobium sp.]|jgi:hypothetical protein|nr:hypothetical protein [Novosphingobium sp.]